MSRAAGARAAERDRLLDVAAGHYAANRFDEAARAYEAAEALDRDDFRASYSLAVIDISTGRLPSAAARLKRVLKQKPDLFPALFNLGSVSQNLGRWEDAASAYARALALRPDASDVRLALAIALAITGRVEEALGHYRALADDPRLGLNALARLAMIRPRAVSDTELARLKAASEDPAVPNATRIALQFALGETLEARGEDDAAFAAFAGGNRMQYEALTAAGPASDPRIAAEDHRRSIERIEALFTPEFVAAHRGQGEESVSPIFIVGMPRTGSTLVEQILASHPQAIGLGEAAPLGEALERRGAYRPETRKHAGLFRGAAEDVLAAWRAAGWTRRLRPVDKTLENYLHVGMIQLIFPRAVILNCVRDPIDTGLACYRQLFETGNETLYDLAQIGETYRGYRQMMAHWARVLPGRVIDVSLETLVADPETQIRWLVEACGLPWDAACLAFYATERPVRTASAAQVRQPIFTTSLDRWRRYEKHLAPLIQALGADAKSA